MSPAATDLGLGSLLANQVADETEEERRKRLLGLSNPARNSTAAQQLFGFGPTGVAASSLGLNGGRGF